MTRAVNNSAHDAALPKTVQQAQKFPALYAPIELQMVQKRLKYAQNATRRNAEGLRTCIALLCFFLLEDAEPRDTRQLATEELMAAICT